LGIFDDDVDTSGVDDEAALKNFSSSAAAIFSPNIGILFLLSIRPFFGGFNINLLFSDS